MTNISTERDPLVLMIDSKARRSTGLWILDNGQHFLKLIYAVAMERHMCRGSKVD